MELWTARLRRLQDKKERLHDSLDAPGNGARYIWWSAMVQCMEEILDDIDIESRIATIHLQEVS
jgi:hypothetical protein